MTKQECLKRAAECNRLAEATSDPDMKLYLMKLALTWMQSATEADEKEQSRLGPRAEVTARQRQPARVRSPLADDDGALGGPGMTCWQALIHG